jgi:FAD/FMN-containing dehydrogenase
MTSVAGPAAAALAAQLAGPLLLPGVPGYEAEVASFNTAVTHRPQIVVGAATAADVQAAVRYAAGLGLSVAVQATGHGASVPIGTGLLVTTARLNGVAVDSAARTATIGAGTRWREVITAAARHELAPLSGSSSGVGAVGFTLGGGLPLMGRTFGFAADRVRAPSPPRCSTTCR